MIDTTPQIIKQLVERDEIMAAALIALTIIVPPIYGYLQRKKNGKVKINSQEHVEISAIKERLGILEKKMDLLLENFKLVIKS